MDKHIWEGWTVGCFIKELSKMLKYLKLNKVLMKGFDLPLKQFKNLINCRRSKEQIL